MKWDLDHDAFHFRILSRNGLNEVNTLFYAAYVSAQRFMEVCSDVDSVSHCPGSSYQTGLARLPLSSTFH